MSPESLVVFLLILGVLVAFHEFGHFIAAKLSGMRVEEFAFGFGPRLLRLFKRRDTEYTVHAFPLGGFVKITGMEPGEEHIPDGFQAQSLWKRALVIFAGPLFSFILAVLLFQLIGVVWGFHDGSKTLNKVLMVSPRTVAARIGLRAGDEILKINDRRVTDGSQMIDIIHASPGKEVTLLVKRDSREFTLSAVPRWSIDYLGANWSFMQGDRAEVKTVPEESTAAKAGVKAKDVLLTFNGKPIIGGQAFDEAIRQNGTNEATLVLTRDGLRVTVRATPSIRTVDLAGVRWYFPGAFAGDLLDKKGSRIKLGDRLLEVNGRKVTSGERLLDAVRATERVALKIERHNVEKPIRLSVAPGKVDSAISESMGLVGFTPQFAFTKMGFVDSLKAGWESTRDLISLIIASLAPKRIGESVGGPILIARQTGITVTLGPYYVVQLAGMLSLSLAVINLFPIPIFDGGHLALLGIEAIRKRRLTREQMQWVQLAGLAIIGMLIVLIFFSDITKIAGGELPQ